MAEHLGRISVALGVKDLAASVDLYERLGFEPIEEDTWNDGYAIFRYEQFILQLMNFIPQKMLVNLIVEDQDSVDATWERLADRGIVVGPAGRAGTKVRSGRIRMATRSFCSGTRKALDPDRSVS